MSAKGTDKRPSSSSSTCTFRPSSFLSAEFEQRSQRSRAWRPSIYTLHHASPSSMLHHHHSRPPSSTTSTSYFRQSSLITDNIRHRSQQDSLLLQESYRSSMQKKGKRMLFLLFAVFALSSALDMSIISFDRNQADGSNWRTDEEVRDLYEHWLLQHGKAFNGLGEKDEKFQIFKDNLRFIDERNAENRTYKLGLNRFADLTNDELRAKYLGTRIDPKRRRSIVSRIRWVEEPRSGGVSEPFPVAEEPGFGVVCECASQGTDGLDAFHRFEAAVG